MTTNENIKILREKRGWSQEDLAKAIGYKNRSTITKIETGKIDLSESRIASFAKVFNVSPAELMGLGNDNSIAPDGIMSLDNVLPLPKTYKVPLVGTIACGQPILAVEEYEETVEVPDYIHADFALRCKGDSMITARIFDGDIVFIRKQPEVENGEIAAVRIEDEATLKKVRLFPDRIILEPANPMYDPIVYRGEEMNNVEILGKAVAFTSML